MIEASHKAILINVLKKKDFFFYITNFYLIVLLLLLLEVINETMDHQLHA